MPRNADLINLAHAKLDYDGIGRKVSVHGCRSTIDRNTDQVSVHYDAHLYEFGKREEVHFTIIGHRSDFIAPHDLGALVIEHTEQLPLPDPEKESYCVMKLVLQTGLMNSRKVLLEFNKFSQIFAKAFDIRTSPFRHGVRYMSGKEKANISCSAEQGTNHLIVSVSFDEKPTSAFRGRTVAFVGAFWEHVKTRIDEIGIVQDQSELGDFTVLHDWGEWAYGEVKKKYPKI